MLKDSVSGFDIYNFTRLTNPVEGLVVAKDGYAIHEQVHGGDALESLFVLVVEDNDVAIYQMFGGCPTWDVMLDRVEGVNSEGWYFGINWLV